MRPDFKLINDGHEIHYKCFIKQNKFNVAINNVDLTKVEKSNAIAIVHLKIKLTDLVMTDIDQFETFIENVTAYYFLDIDLLTGEILNIGLDDITFDGSYKNGEMFLHEELELILEECLLLQPYKFN